MPLLGLDLSLVSYCAVWGGWEVVLCPDPNKEKMSGVTSPNLVLAPEGGVTNQQLLSD